LNYCNQYLAYLDMMYGMACVAAFEDFLVCLGGLSCIELMGGGAVCPAEGAAFEMLCV
jgi:hypothetical protein